MPCKPAPFGVGHEIGARLSRHTHTHTRGLRHNVHNTHTNQCCCFFFFFMECFRRTSLSNKATWCDPHPIVTHYSFSFFSPQYLACLPSRISFLTHTQSLTDSFPSLLLPFPTLTEMTVTSTSRSQPEHLNLRSMKILKKKPMYEETNNNKKSTIQAGIFPLSQNVTPRPLQKRF